MQRTAWTLVILRGADSGLASPPPAEVSKWRIRAATLGAADPDKLDSDLLLLDLPPDTDGLAAWLARFRLLQPDAQVLLAEGEAGPEWYRAAIGLGVDGLLHLPLDDAGWESYLAESAEALQAGAEQQRILGRLERGTQSLEKSRRQLAELLLESYENLGRLHAQLTRRLEQLSALYELGRDLSLEANWDRALEQFLKSCMKEIKFRGVALLLWSFDEERLSLRSRRGLESAELVELMAALRALPVAQKRSREVWALESGRLVSAGSLDPAASSWELSVLPLVHGGEAQGFLVTRKLYRSRESFEGDLHFLRTVQALLGEELANAKSIQRLKRLGELHRSVLESVPAAVLTVDGRGRVLYRNPAAARLFGERCGVGAAFGWEPDFHFLDGRPAELEQEWAQRECFLRKETGEVEKRLLVSTTLLPPRHERDPRVVMICEDLTEYKRLEGELRQAERLSSLGRLSAGVAHEIRNPLAGIATTAQVLQSRLDAASQAHPFLDRIQQEIQRLERIVRSLLDLSRPVHPELGNLDLRAASERALEAAASRAAAAGVSLEAPEAGPELHALGDSDLIHQVLLNLLLNAVEACPAQGRAGLRLERCAAAGSSEERVRVCVHDTGSGIAPDVAERLFEPFVSNKAEGTGLGLAICRKIIEEHGGRIGHRPRPGGGTEFFIELTPARSATSQQEARV